MAKRSFRGKRKSSSGYFGKHPKNIKPSGIMEAHKLQIEYKKLVLACLLAVIIVYSVCFPVLSCKALSFDDDQYLTGDIYIQNPSIDSAIKFISEVTNPSAVYGYYQPLTLLSLMLDCSFGGSPGNLTPFHRTSLLLHIFNALLIIMILYVLFKKVWISFAAGLIFGIHPLSVETIAWIGERKTVLAAFFALMSLLLYIVYTKSRTRGILWFSITAYALALLSKPTSTTLPLVLLLFDYWPLERLKRPFGKSVRPLVIEKIPFFILCAASSVITYISQATAAGAHLPRPNGLAGAFFAICRNLMFYLYKIILPVKLTSHYPDPQTMSLADSQILAGVIGISVLAVLLVISMRWTKSFVTGFLIFFTAIFPTIGIVRFSDVMVSDKYAYLPSIGLLVVLAWAAKTVLDSPRLFNIRKIVLVSSICLLLAAAGMESFLTRSYIYCWKDTETLFRHMLSLDSKSYTIRSVLGNALIDEKKYDEAFVQLKECIRLKPDYAVAHNSIGIMMELRGKPDEALKYYKEAIRIQPEFVVAYDNIGALLYKQGKPDSALKYFKKAISINPDYIKGYSNIGGVLYMQGKYSEAISYYEKALKVYPDLPVIKHYIELCREHLGKDGK